MKTMIMGTLSFSKKMTNEKAINENTQLRFFSFA